MPILFFPTDLVYNNIVSSSSEKSLEQQKNYIERDIFSCF